jgi:Uma2 family endonuclease
MAHSPGAAADGRKARVIMMDMATTTLMSFAEFEQVEQGADQIELLNGELIRMPPAENSHMDVCEALFEKLKSAVARLRQATPDLTLGKVHMERG